MQELNQSFDESFRLLGNFLFDHFILSGHRKLKLNECSQQKSKDLNSPF